MAAGTIDEDRDPLILESFLWGLLSAVSLNFGSIIGVTCLPRKKVRAILMSFGGGALLFALSIELFGHVLHQSEEDDDTAPVWCMEGSAVVGGVLFALLNRALNAYGADLRKPSTTKGRFARLRALLLRRLAWRLRKIEFFSVLSMTEVRDLIQTAMFKERFNAADIIMSHESRDCGIFFIISGKVRLHIFDQEMLPGQTVADAQTHEHLLHTWDLGPNQVFGDMTVLTGTYITTMAIAHEATKVLVLPGHELARLIDNHTKVREVVSMRAVERLRQIDVLRSLSNTDLGDLSSHCHTVTFQPGEVVFTGTVDESTAIVCVVLGSIEVVRHKTGARKVLHANRLLCTEHLMFGHNSGQFTATALEPTSVLVIERSELNKALPSTDPSAFVGRSMGPVMTLGEEDNLWQVRTSKLDGETSFHEGSTKSTEGNNGCAMPPMPMIVNIQQVDCPSLPSLDSSMSKVKPGERVVLPGQVTSESPEPRPDMVLSVEAIRRDRDRHHTGNSAYSLTDDFDEENELACTPREVDKASPSPSEQRLLEHLGHDLGWDDDNPDVPTDAPGVRLARGTSMEELPVAFITDQELEEREIELEELNALKFGRSSTVSVSDRQSLELQDGETKRSFSKGLAGGLVMSHSGGQISEDAKLLDEEKDGNRDLSERIKEKERRRSTQYSDEERLGSPKVHGKQTSDEHHKSDGGKHGHHGHAHGSGHHAAIMVWLGILIDAVPESLVIGILMNKSAAEGKSSTGAALPFVIGVFLSNLPESMSSSGSMKAHGMRISTILMMWMTIVVVTAIGAMMGAIIFPPSIIKDPATVLLVAAVEGIAAGAMLTMIAQTMMPEAFEQGGDVVGLSCLAGFLCALMVKLIPTD